MWTFRASYRTRIPSRSTTPSAAMGMLVHPNYTDELANGVAVSFDPVSSDLARTQPLLRQQRRLARTWSPIPSSPLGAGGAPAVSRRRLTSVLSTSNQAGLPGEMLMSDLPKLCQLSSSILTTIHDHFEALYQPCGTSEPFAMEIEFKITSEDVLAIKQARPWVFGETPLTTTTTTTTTTHDHNARRLPPPRHW